MASNPRIGVDMAHYAVLKDDPFNIDPKAADAKTPVYDDPVPCENTATVNISSSDTTTTSYYDNLPKFALASKSDRQLTWGRADFTGEEEQALLGLSLDSEGIEIEGAESNPPYIAYGFRRKRKSPNGVIYDYVWYLKGVLTKNADNSQTQQQSVTIQDQEMQGTFIARQADGQIRIRISTDDPNVTQTMIDNWFTAVTLNKLRIAAATPAPTVTGVTVTPAAATVAPGGTENFSATVAGTNSPAQTVTWNVTGGSSADTVISSGGVLTVGADESAASLTVTAASTVDSTKTGTAAVAVDA